VRVLNKKIWPYQIHLKIDNNLLIEEWCVDAIGLRTIRWYNYYTYDRVIYSFKDQADLLAFKLRWK
jgi:hypothetical protein